MREHTRIFLFARIRKIAATNIRFKVRVGLRFSAFAPTMSLKEIGFSFLGNNQLQ
jgi:hypothetical protein